MVHVLATILWHKTFKGEGLHRFCGLGATTMSFLYKFLKCSCPRDASPSAHAQPKALSGKQLGGVDQATLRQSLSRHGDSQNPVVDYLNDSELWMFMDTMRQLEAMQLSIIKNDIQVHVHVHAHVHMN